MLRSINIFVVYIEVPLFWQTTILSIKSTQSRTQEGKANVGRVPCSKPPLFIPLSSLKRV